MQKLMSDLLEAQLETPWGQSLFLENKVYQRTVHNSPIMSIEIEFDDICWSIMGRKVIVVDVSLSSTSLLVNLVSLIEGCATEVRWLPMAYERIYRKWHCVCKGEKIFRSAWKSKNAFFSSVQLHNQDRTSFSSSEVENKKVIIIFPSHEP
jgi:hypothetical protein